MDREAIAAHYGRHPNDMGGAVQLAMVDARIAHLREGHLAGRQRNDNAAGRTVLKLMRRRTMLVSRFDRENRAELARYFQLAAQDPAWVARQRRRR